MLFLCGRFGLDGGAYQAVEYAGSAVDRAADAGAHDARQHDRRARRAGGSRRARRDDARLPRTGRRARGRDSTPGRATRGAPLAARHVFDAAALEPQVAAPHSPANARPVSAFDDERIDVAYVGACTGAKLEDLRMAARVLKGRKVASGVALLVAPASRRDEERARAEGVLGTLRRRGRALAAERLRPVRGLR